MNSIKTTCQPVWWKEAFQLDAEKMGRSGKDIDSATLYRYSDQISCLASYALGPKSEEPGYDFSYLSALLPTESDDIGKPLTDLSMLEIVLDSDIKYTYRFYERGVEVSKLRPGPGGKKLSGEYGENKRLAVDLQAYQTLLSSLRSCIKDKFCYGSSWLDIMRQSNVERMVITSSDEKQTTKYDRESLKQFLQVFSTIQRIHVEPRTCRKVLPNTKLDMAAHVQINFYNDICYDIWHDGKTLLITSSDMDYAIKYKTHQDYILDELDDMACGHLCPLTAKPVIYLYPEKPTDVSVKLHYKGNFTYTYPTYHSGWRVTAYPDGRLVNHSDMSEHYYLFWEGTAAIDWNFQKGFVVKGNEAEQFLIEKLSYLGLTPREYNDFIVYWLSELQQNEYNFVTFSTKQYEELAPLEISPAPDSVLRVHMVYKKIPQPISIEPQMLKPFVRKGFTVVEWGGSRA